MAPVPACLDKPMTPYEQVTHQLIGQIGRSCEKLTYWRKELGTEREKERTLREQVLSKHSEMFAGASRVISAMKKMLDARKAVCADADGRRALGREGKSLDFAGNLGTRGEAMKVQALLRGRSDAREAPQRRSYSPRAGSGSRSSRAEPQAERQRRASLATPQNPKRSRVPGGTTPKSQKKSRSPPPPPGARSAAATGAAFFDSPVIAAAAPFGGATAAVATASDNDQLCVMSARLNADVLTGTWAYTDGGAVAGTFQYDVSQSVESRGGVHVMDLNGSFSLDTKSAVSDQLELAVRADGRVGGKGKSKCGAYAVLGEATSDGALILRKFVGASAKAIKAASSVAPPTFFDSPVKAPRLRATERKVYSEALGSADDDDEPYDDDDDDESSESDGIFETASSAAPPAAAPPDLLRGLTRGGPAPPPPPPPVVGTDAADDALARAAALRRSGCTRNSTAAAVAREDEGSDDDDDVATRGPTRGHPSPLQTWRPPVVTPVAPTAPAAPSDYDGAAAWASKALEGLDALDDLGGFVRGVAASATRAVEPTAVPAPSESGAAGYGAPIGVGGDTPGGGTALENVALAPVLRAAEPPSGPRGAVNSGCAPVAPAAPMGTSPTIVAPAPAAPAPAPPTVVAPPEAAPAPFFAPAPAAPAFDGAPAAPAFGGAPAASFDATGAFGAAAPAPAPTTSLSAEDLECMTPEQQQMHAEILRMTRRLEASIAADASVRLAVPASAAAATAPSVGVPSSGLALAALAPRRFDEAGEGFAAVFDDDFDDLGGLDALDDLGGLDALDDLVGLDTPSGLNVCDDGLDVLGGLGGLDVGAESHSRSRSCSPRPSLGSRLEAQIRGIGGQSPGDDDDL